MKKVAVNTSDDIQQRVAEVVTQFEAQYMALQPKSVLVDLHESHVLVTLRQVASAAERQCAGNQAARERLEKLAAALFDTVKAPLETQVAEIIGRPVRRSRISMDLVAGDAIISFVLEEADPSHGPGVTQRP